MGYKPRTIHKKAEVQLFNQQNYLRVAFLQFGKAQHLGN